VCVCVCVCVVVHTQSAQPKNIGTNCYVAGVFPLGYDPIVEGKIRTRLGVIR
jgi:hypothetical protein